MIEIIEEKKLKQKIELSCSECGAVLIIETTNKDAAFTKARELGGVVTRDRKTYYCAKCAPHHRYLGRNGTRRANVQTRIPGIK